MTQAEKKKERVKRQREAAAAESQGLAPPPRKAQKVAWERPVATEHWYLCFNRHRWQQLMPLVRLADLREHACLGRDTHTAAGRRERS